MAERRYAAVIGPGECDEATAALAERVGAGLARAGFTVVTGGAFGAMEAASRGAAQAGGTVVGVLPGADRRAGNEWSDIAIPTGLGHARNLVVGRASFVVIAVGGGWGTLSVMALGGGVGRPVVSLGGWKLDHVTGAPSEIAYAETPADAVELAGRMFDR